jgi:DNA end-binding protein Ku
MPRAVWRGTISFGLVTVQVRLYPAIKRRGVRFRELDRRTGQRVRHQRVVPAPAWHPPDDEGDGQAVRLYPTGDGTQAGAQAPAGRPSYSRPGLAPERPPASAAGPPEAEVARQDLVRGYEYSPGQFVPVTDEELAELAPERTKTIDVEQFVSRRDLDPVFLDTPYYVVPDGSPRPFAVLLRAMQQTNRAAICWIVLRSRRHLAALQPRGRLMLLTTLLFSDEIVASRGLEPRLPDDLQDREIEMAELLLSTLGGPWEPERYRDEYREKVLALVEGRAAAEQFVEESEQRSPAPAGVEELLAALTASVEEARARRRAEDETRPARRRRGA